MVTQRPMQAITENDKRRLEIPASIPINGGPIRKPKKLMVDTDARAIPRQKRSDFTAAP